MIKKLAPCLCLLASEAVFATEQISTTEAPFYTGKDVIACGSLAEVSRFKRGLYLNMDAAYPKQSVTFVLWEGDIADAVKRLGSVEGLVGKRVCAKGTVTEYNGRSQISMYNAYSLTLP